MGPTLGGAAAVGGLEGAANFATSSAVASAGRLENDMVRISADIDRANKERQAALDRAEKEEKRKADAIWLAEQKINFI